jgi:hypothetical protein
MLPTPSGILWRLVPPGLLLLAACQADSHLAPTPVGAITGTVTSPELGALALQVLAVSASSGGTDSAQTDPVTGAYGPLTISSGGETIEIIAVHRGCALPPAQAVSVAAGDTVTVNFAVDCTQVAVHGQLISPTLGPLDTVTVSATGGSGTFTSQTDRGGTFTFDRTILGLGTGPFSITISVTGGLPASCTPPSARNVSVAYGGTTSVPFSVDCP